MPAGVVLPATGANVSQPNLDQLAINTIRTLSMDAVQQANSGHPGTPMALAPVAYAIWQKFLRFDPNDPIWPNRDRFVLSNGHASMLLYSLLHLAQVKAVNPEYEMPGHVSVTLDDIKRFRQIDSRAPGHPEYRWTSGVETTTGPLGQGVATSVGMAMARWWLGEHFNRPGFEIFDYNVYAICGDGCMMEGISSEAASLAAHHKLSNLVWIWDNNHITIEGSTKIAFTEDVASRFKAYGWNTVHLPDANDLGAIEKALHQFNATNDRPTFVTLDSHIGFGAPHKQDTSAAHGEALGEEEIKLTKKNYGWPEDAKFLVPDGVYDQFKNGVGKRGAEAHSAWNAKFEDYKKQFPQLADQLSRMQSGQLPDGWDKNLPNFPADPKGMATRESSGKTLNALAANIPWMMGGSADLAKSNKTNLTFEGAGDFFPDAYHGRNIHFGVREHAMGAIVNGITLSKLRAFSATFFNFSDYMRPSMRLGALMEIPAIYIFTHDSIGVGEDGPTHQPVEQLASYRAMPNMLVFRPGDANEVVEAYKIALQHMHGPSTLVLTRQAMPTFDRTKYAPVSGVAKGAYVLADAAGGKPDVILLASGSEVGLCAAAYEKLTAEGVIARVVSMPSWELFEKQGGAYKESVLPGSVTARFSGEMESVFGWDRYVGPKGKIIGMRSFGASAPLKDLLKKFGFELENVLAAVKEVMGK